MGSKSGSQRVEGRASAGTAWLLALCLAHAVLAIAYAAQTPYRTPGRLFFQGGQVVPDIGAPDERQHANYVQHILDGNGIPVFRAGSPDLYETYQSHQPPSYYFLAAGWAKLVGVEDVSDRSAGARLRWLNALLGALGVAGAYFLAWFSFKRWEIAASAAAVYALLPMNVALSSAITNDPMMFAACAWALAAMAYGARFGWNAKRAAVVGVLCGLAVVTKTNAVALLPALAVALLWTLDRRKNLRFLAVALLVFAVVVAPWWVRNTSLYGDPLAMGAFTRGFEGSPKAADFMAQFGVVPYWTQWVGWWVLRSMVGVFGYMDIFLPSALYACVLLAAALLVAARAGLRDDSLLAGSMPIRMACGVFFVVTLMFFVRFNALYFQGQARYLLPALAPIGCTLALGAHRLFQRAPGLAPAMVAAILLGLNVYALSVLPREFERRVVEPGSAQNPGTRAVASTYFG